jgi:hypothetical protein
VAKKRIGMAQGTNLTRGMRGSIRSLAHVMFEEARDDLMAAIADGAKLKKESAPVALRMLLTVTPAQVADVRQKLHALLEGIRKDCKRHPPPDDALRWALTVAFAPRGKLTEE